MITNILRLVFFGLFVAITEPSPLLAQSALVSDAEHKLDELLVDDSLWSLSQSDFYKKYKGLGFQWTDSSKGSARAHRDLQWLNKNVGESILSFKNNQAKQLQLSLYNRGDDGYLHKNEFTELFSYWKEQIGSLLEAEPKKRERSNQSAVKSNGFIWNHNNVAYLLEYSMRKEQKSKDLPFRAEFIRLRVAPTVKKSLLEEKMTTGKRVLKADLPANVEKEETDVWIGNIPMVDQGDKGYCVVATAARVFGYYGMPVDQHELAQAANSSASEGTSTEAMVEEVKKISRRYKLRLKTLREQDHDDMEDLSEDYNRFAKRAKKRRLPSSWGSGHNLWENYDDFDADLLKELKNKGSASDKFLREVKQNIDSGIPLLWTVKTGIYSEPRIDNDGSRSNHMRMIIGYSEVDRDIIYSDSWGKGHAKKYLDLGEALAMTRGLYAILPNK